MLARGRANLELFWLRVETLGVPANLAEPHALARAIANHPPRRPTPRAQKLDPFKPLIHERLTTYPLLSSVRLLAECRATGYDGGVTQLRDYVAGIRPRPEPEPILRFETAPGVQAQFDFAEVRLPWGKR